MRRICVDFEGRKIPAQKLRSVPQKLRDILGKNAEIKITTVDVSFENKKLFFSENPEGEAQFFEKYSGEVATASIAWESGEAYRSAEAPYEKVGLEYWKYSSTSKLQVSIILPNVSDMYLLVSIFEGWFEGSPLDVLISDQEKKRFEPRVFLGHGRSPLWKDLRDHLRDIHKFSVEAYESGSRAGHTIRDIVDEMTKSSDIAFLVHTAEDELKDGSFQTRPNVIHETGLFQGKLGFSRAIVVLEEDCQEFSNLAGIQQIRFPKGKIRETFGDVLGVIRREFNSE